MIASLFLFASAATLGQSAPGASWPPQTMALNCELRTPASDILRFRIAPAGEWQSPRISLSPLGQSNWPKETISAKLDLDDMDVAYRLENGDGAFELRVGKEKGPRNATLFLRRGERAGVVAAFGFCSSDELEALPLPAVQDGNPFDPARWDGACHFVSSGPRSQRSTFVQEFAVEPSRGPVIKFDPKDSVIWTSLLSVPVEASQAAKYNGILIDPLRFGNGSDGVRGVALTYVDPDLRIGTMQIRFSNFGGVDQQQRGYAICRVNVGQPTRISTK